MAFDIIEAVKEVIRTNRKRSKKSIARILLKEFPGHFKDLETARFSVRRYTKATGKDSDKEFITMDNNFTAQNPYGLPDSYSEERKPYVLPVANDNILILSDLHIPYHDIPALNAAIKYGLAQKVNTVFINGDLLDFYQMSRFMKDPRKRSVKLEMEAAIKFLTNLRNIFKNCGIYYHLGNHDIRYQTWLMAHPEIFDDPYYELEARLGLIKLNIHLIDDRTITKAGKLSIHHGHYIFRGSYSPVSPARTILLKAKQSMVCGHTHKISEATNTNLDGDIYSCWSTGSLCELTPDYFPMCNDYGHGFSHVNINPGGTFSLTNIRIFKGKIL